MQFIVGSGAFNSALKKLIPASENNSILPILENVKCVVKGRELNMTLTNLNLTITVTVGCEAKKDFEMLLPFKQVLKITNELPGQPLKIENTEIITLSGDTDKYKLGKREDVINFPNVPEVDELFSFEADSDFVHYFSFAKNFTVKEQNALRLKGIFFDIKDGLLNIVGTDSSQLFKGIKTVGGKINYSVVVPVEFSNAIKPFTSGTVSGNEKFIQFKTKDISIYQVLSEEKMIPYGQFFNNNAHNCTVRKQDILSAINRVMVFDNRFYWVDFYFVENGIEIKYADHDLNQYYETKIPSTHSVSFQKITFNAVQLKNVISVLADDDVLIYFDNPKSFINIQSEDKSIELILVPIEPSQLK